MISVSYIHALDDEEVYKKYETESMKYIQECMSSLDDIINGIGYKSEFMESVDEYITEADGIFKKIGDKIIELFKKAKQFIDSIINKIREKTWDDKRKRKLLLKLKQENPELASRISYQVDAKKLSLNDFKDISDFYRNIDSILDELEKKDAKSLKGKAIKAKEKLASAKNVILDIGAIAGTVSTVILAISQLENYTVDREIRKSIIDRSRNELNKKGNKLNAKFSTKVGNTTIKMEAVDEAICEASEEKLLQQIKTRDEVLQEIAHVVTSTSTEICRDNARYINMMDSMVDRTIAKGGV